MKRTWSCPKCSSQRVGYLEHAFDDHNSGAPHRMIGRVVTGSVFQQRMPLGPVEVFVCTVCGYFEEYVKHPENVPWDRLKGFRWCQPPPGA